MSRAQKHLLCRIIVSLAVFVFSFIVPELPYLRLALCIISYLTAGYDILYEAFLNIIRGQIFDEKFLMAIASLGAFCIGENHEAVFVMVFFRIGEHFESLAVGRSRRAVAELMMINPEYANIMRCGRLISVPPEDISVGEIIIIKAGERIPLDGEIVEGSTSVDTSALTGEALPKDLGVGDCVISGCINISGLIKVRVSRAYSDSTVKRILVLVEESAASKSKSESFITSFARYYTPAVVISALLLAIVPPLFTGEWGEWIHRALVFLVVSCPCALVISVPLSYFGGIGKASKEGILVKGSNYLDTLSRANIFVFDKTGTLTKGDFSVKDIHSNYCEERQLLLLAARAEFYSDHPIAESIRSALDPAIDPAPPSSSEEIAGFGIKALIDAKTVLVGNRKLMDAYSIDKPDLQVTGTAVHIAADGVYLGCIEISDEPKPDSSAAVKGIKEKGAEKCMMLTGDSAISAGAIASSLGLDEVYSQLLPEDKLNILEKIISNNHGGTTVYVGDGINDAPCLSRADVGIAMGAFGTDAAIEAADIVLMDDKPSKLVTAISIARKTRGIVKQNIVFALGVKFAVLILGVMGIAGMWSAVFADVGVCMIAVLNAVRTQK